MKITRRHHYSLLAITLIMTVVCAVMIPKVRINSDMTKYLPDSSRMKEGLSIIEQDFGGAQMAVADVRVMFKDLSEDEKTMVSDSLARIPQVDGVSFRTDGTGQYTLYELNVSKSVDQKTMGSDITLLFPGREVVVETSQDSITPPVSVLVIAAVLIVLILVLMAQSWLEPLIFLMSTGVAVVLNIGSNALLPYVSITTNYIVAILQMVLSLDYSIVLINRYRQEQDDDKTSAQAINTAIRKAFPSIFSSALTTIVGLGMLCFMNLKIGMDMGVVLGKGVLLSLICAFTVLPSLLMLFDAGVRNTSKKTFVLPTDRIGRFATHNKVALSLFAILLFAASFYFSRKTDISFAKPTESRITKFFPQKNPLVLLYDTADEMAILSLADSLQTIDEVESLISYPTIFKKEYTADELVNQLAEMASQFSDYASDLPQDGLSQLSPEIMRLIYYLRFKDDPSLRVTFPEMADFILKNCVNNPLFASYIDEDMREKLSLLESMGGLEEEEEEEPEIKLAVQPEVIVLKENAPQTPSETVSQPKQQPKPQPKPATAKPTARRTDDGRIAIVSIIPKIADAYPSELSDMLVKLVDTAAIHVSMTPAQISRYIGSTTAQTRMAFSFSKSKTLSPYEYVHFIADDLFSRKALAPLVSSEQKSGLRLREKIMDYADANARLSASEISAMVTEFGIVDVTEKIVRELAAPKLAAHTEAAPEPHAELPVRDSVKVKKDTVAVTPVTETVAPRPLPLVHTKTAEERQAELFASMMASRKGYTASELSKNFKHLGQDISPETVSLLYAYWGSVNDYDESWKMGVEELMNYGVDTLMNDPRLKAFVSDSMKVTVSGAKAGLNNGLGMLRNDNHSLMVVMTSLPVESAGTYEFIDRMDKLTRQCVGPGCYMVGESVMYSEMKAGFSHELRLVTWLTVLAIFLIVALSFRSLIVPTILVMTVMTAVYVNVVFSGLFSGSMLYLAYLIVQSILMGATIDYGILFTNYYKEKRRTMPVDEAVSAAYKGSIRTIMTSGLIMVAAPGAMSLMVKDMTISAIVGSIAIGAFVAIVLILGVLPGVLVVFDKYVVRNKKK